MPKRGHNIKISKLIENNVGVSQGSHLRAQLFIIYDDSVMNEYKKKYSAIKIKKPKTVFRGYKTEFARGEYMFRQSKSEKGRRNQGMEIK